MSFIIFATIMKRLFFLFTKLAHHHFLLQLYIKTLSSSFLSHASIKYGIIKCGSTFSKFVAVQLELVKVTLF